MVRGSKLQGAREQAEHAFEYRILLADGTVKHVRTLRRTVLNDSGEVVEVVGTTLDITERKLAEQEREKLHKLEAELLHMNRVSTMGEMTASLAHEVKQPIFRCGENAGSVLGTASARTTVCSGFDRRLLQRCSDPPNVQPTSSTACARSPDEALRSEKWLSSMMLFVKSMLYYRTKHGSIRWVFICNLRENVPCVVG